MSVMIQRESTEYLYVGITGSPPSTDQELAFLEAPSRPTEQDWNAAILVDDQHPLWNAANAVATGDYFVAILIGAFGETGVELLPGDYQIWVRLTDTDERPVRIAPVTLEVL